MWLAVLLSWIREDLLLLVVQQQQQFVPRTVAIP